MKRYRRMTPFRSVCITLMVTVLMLMVAYPMTTNAIAASSQVIELRFAHHLPLTSKWHLILQEWATKVEKQSGGRVKFTFYPVASLVKPMDAYNATVKGICDITISVTALQGSRCILTSITDLPGLRFGKNENVALIFDKLFRKFPEIQAEFKDVRILFSAGLKGPLIHTSKRKIQRPEDIKGMKIAAEMPFALILKNIGASPVSIGPTDLSSSLERGVVEGTVLPLIVLNTYKLYQFAAYHSDVGMGFQSVQVIINLDRWRSLPPDVQEIIDAHSPWASQATCQYFQEQFDSVKNELGKISNQTFVEVTAQDLELWQHYYEAFMEKWIADREAKKLPGKAAFSEAMQLIKEYQK